MGNSLKSNRETTHRIGLTTSVSPLQSKGNGTFHLYAKPGPDLQPLKFILCYHFSGLWMMTSWVSHSPFSSY